MPPASAETTVRTRRPIGLEQMATAARNISLRDAVRKWLANDDMNIVAGFHLPSTLTREMARLKISADEISLSAELRHFFNRLDCQTFKNAYRRHGVRIRRDVLLECTDTVGWHAHVLLSCPSITTPTELSLCMQRLWHQQFKKHLGTSFDDRLYWCAARTGDYLGYSTKFVSGEGVVDWMNTVRT